MKNAKIDIWKKHTTKLTVIQVEYEVAKQSEICKIESKFNEFTTHKREKTSNYIVLTY